MVLEFKLTHILTIHLKHTHIHTHTHTHTHNRVTITASAHSSTGSSVSPSCCLHGWMEISSVRVCLCVCFFYRILPVSSCFWVFYSICKKVWKEKARWNNTSTFTHISCTTYCWCVNIGITGTVFAMLY